jgi:hypothetical protein
MPRNRVTGIGGHNAICDVCGLKYKADELLKRWDGAMVCKWDWEPRHPQEFIRAKRDVTPLPFTRPDENGLLSYTPTWGLINATGNADIVGEYSEYTEADSDKVINVHVRATMGSTTTYTAGTWTITVPVTNGANEVTGSASAFFGQRWVQGFATLPAASSTVTIRSETGAQWSDTVPFTWTTDARFSLSIRYGTDT